MNAVRHKTGPFLPGVFAALALCFSASGAAAPALDATAVFEKVSPAVVALTCRRGQREMYFGTGTIIDPAGLVLTSTTVVPKDGVDLRVYLRGSRVLPAKLVLTDDSLELALVRIAVDGKDDAGPFPHVELGNSASVKLGDAAFTLGNCFRSIQADDQVSLGKGIVSGFYKLTKTYSQSKYTGAAIETTAPLNSGTDGGPLVDARGRLIGLLSLNYSTNRWLGTAVPVNLLKPLLWKHLRIFNDGEAAYRCSIGIVLEERTGGDVRVTRVEPHAPAALAGLAPQDRVTELGGKAVASVPAFRDAFRKLKPGKPVLLTITRGSKTLKLRVPAWGRF